METPNSALPDIGVTVPLPADINLESLDTLSLGQLAYVSLVVQGKLADRMADPATAHDFPQYQRAPGADWSGHEGPPPEEPETSTAHGTDGSRADDPTDEHGHPIIAPRPLPKPPENSYDAIPVVADMLRRIHHSHEAVLTHFVRQLQPVFTSQPEYLGTPEGITAFKDSTAYFKEVLRFSWQTTKKFHERMPYVTWNPGQDPTMEINQPKLPRLAEAFKQGTIPGENLDRIVALDQDLTKYVTKVGKQQDYKDAILREFEPTLIEAAESSSPDAFSSARRRWADKIVHHIDQDGPPLRETLRKKADNALRTQDYTDGSGKIWMHATPDVYAEFKNFAINQLNRNGSPIKLDDALAEFLTVPADNANDKDATENPADVKVDAAGVGQVQDTKTEDSLFGDQPPMPQSSVTLDDLTIDRDPEQPMAATKTGKIVTEQQLNSLETLKPGQTLGIILIGLFRTILTMDPEQLQLKKSHSAASTLTIIQDIETAYKTLGIGTLPEEAQRPRGPHGIVPTVLKRPNPHNTASAQCNNPDHLLGFKPPPWTGYISEALNIGALHPQDAKLLACDSKLVGQIWNQHHSVLNQRRAQRIFTAAQRQAILARDRGCQAPGCTIIAALCQIHHLKPWELGGKTDVDNAISLCAFHHGAVHNEKWTIRTINGTHFFQPAPWLEPTQPLLRNLYWSL